MVGARFLLGGILALAAVLAITAAIIAVAPYLAIVIVGVGLIWLLRGEMKPPELEPGKEPLIKPVKPPGE